MRHVSAPRETNEWMWTDRIESGPPAGVEGSRSPGARWIGTRSSSGSIAPASNGGCHRPQATTCATAHPGTGSASPGRVVPCASSIESMASNCQLVPAREIGIGACVAQPVSAGARATNARRCMGVVMAATRLSCERPSASDGRMRHISARASIGAGIAPPCPCAPRRRS